MAEIKKIVRNPGLSNFDQVGPQGGGSLLMLADMAQQAYEFMKPAAMEQAANLGAEEGAELARRQIGQTEYPKVDYSTSGGLGGFAPDANYAQIEGEIGDDYYRSIRAAESGGNDQAKNPTSSATGRYQFIQGTWDQLRKSRPDLGLTADGRTDAAQQERAIRAFTADNAKVLKNAGVAITNGTLYAAHFLGAGGAAKVLTKGAEVAISEIVGPAVMKANSFLQGMTVGDFRAWAEKKGGGRLRYGDQPTADTSRFSMTEGGAPSEEGGEPTTITASTPADTPAAPYTPPTLLQTASGEIEARTFSPLSGPILQAHRAAQMTTYMAEMSVKGSADMMAMSEQFIGDPGGFQEAARSYIDQAVKDAPEMMRGEMRSKLTEGAQRRFLGMVEENHREIRQRADNSSRALVDRYSDEYAEILATGDMDRAAGARAQLEEALINRESMPGVAWTREQSQNILLGSQEKARSITERNAAKVTSQRAGQLRTIIKAAENGMSAEDEAILDDPSIYESNPELAREAAGKVALREMMPGFFSLPPAEMNKAIDNLKSQPVQDGWETEIVGAMETARNGAVAALEKDPIAFAQARMKKKPPEIDNFDPTDVDSFVSSLQARAAYAEDMAAQGYVDEPVYLSDKEVETLSVAMSKDAPPEVKAAIAGAIVAGFGEGATQVFSALKADPVVTWGGSMMAKGGSAAVASEAMRGQQAIAEGIAQVPEAKKWREAMDSVRPALAGLPANTIQAESDVMKFAQAIYAARSMTPGFDATDTEGMTDAIQAALGQTTNTRGQKVGGIQELFGQPTLMPVGANAAVIEKKVQDQFFRGGIAGFGDIVGGSRTAADTPDFWAKASTIEMPDGSFKSGGVPRVGGEPLPLKMITGGDVRFVPVGGTRYRMEVQRSGKTLDVHTAEGTLYIIDMARIE